MCYKAIINFALQLVVFLICVFIYIDYDDVCNLVYLLLF